MHRKSQLNQLFIMIFVVVVVGLLVIIAFNFIRNMNQSKKDVDIRVFENDFKTAAGGVRYLAGTTKTVGFSVPKGVATLCVIDWGGTAVSPAGIPDVVWDAVDTDFVEGKDVFLLMESGSFTTFGASDLRTQDGYMVDCYNISKTKFSGRFEGVSGGFRFVYLG